jgi:hypothetical protein
LQEEVSDEQRQHGAEDIREARREQAATEDDYDHDKQRGRNPVRRINNREKLQPLEPSEYAQMNSSEIVDDQRHRYEDERLVAAPVTSDEEAARDNEGKSSRIEIRAKNDRASEELARLSMVARDLANDDGVYAISSEFEEERRKREREGEIAKVRLRDAASHGPEEEDPGPFRDDLRDANPNGVGEKPPDWTGSRCCYGTIRNFGVSVRGDSLPAIVGAGGSSWHSYAPPYSSSERTKLAKACTVAGCSRPSPSRPARYASCAS